MEGVDALLNEPDIKTFLEKNQNVADRIRRAAARLVDGGKTPGENLLALKKLLPSLADQAIQVFFSYKTKDEVSARTIVELLRRNAAGRLKIVYQREFQREIAGQEWRQHITRAVRRSNWFILLLPDPSDELDWCLFETGLFDGQLTAGDRLICLHHPKSDVPDPIKDYQAFAATPAQIEKFLQMVYVEEDPIFGLPPINPSIGPMLPELAVELVDAITAPEDKRHRTYLVPWIAMRHDAAAAMQSRDDLDAAEVLGINGLALDLFGLIKPMKTLGELWRASDEEPNDGQWREELFRVVRKIANGKAFRPIQAVLSGHNGKMYRPTVTAITRSGEDGPVRLYHVTFVEDAATPNLGGMPADLAMLATLLRFTFRFRWEALEPFSHGALGDGDVVRLEAALARIKADWESHGTFDRDAVRGLFSEDQRDKLDEMFLAWGRLSNAEQDGDLDVAIRERDGARIPTLLASLLPSNQRFLEMAAARFAQLIGESDRREEGATP